MDRRRFLCGVGSASLLFFSGCSALPTLGKRFNLSIVNFHEESREVYVTLIRRDATDIDQGTVYDKRIEVSGSESGGGEIESRNNIVESRPYLVRVTVRSGEGSVNDHYHFYPDCAGEEGPEERLYIEIRPSEDGTSTIEFSQNGC